LLVLIVLAVLPNVIWATLDKTPWPWDQAWYGKFSVELFFTLIARPSEWIPAMLGVLGRMAPGIVWIGQFFVPLGLAIGSIDMGLRLSIILTQMAALIFAIEAISEFCDRRLGAALTGLAVMAGAPLFVAMSHVYLAEMLQTAAVAGFVLLMARAPAWSRLRTVAYLILATSFAMLAKVSSPVYCLAPGLWVLYYLARPQNPHPTERRAVTVVVLVFALITAVATGFWYYENFTILSAHVSMASSGQVAELYGKREELLASLTFWLHAFQNNFFILPTAVVAVAAVAAAGVMAMVRREGVLRPVTVAAALAIAQIAIVVLAFSLNSNRDNRYLLPALPYVALAIAWAAYRMNRTVVASVLTGVFACQWGYVHAQALGLIPRAADAAPWLNTAMRDPSYRRLLDLVVSRTCADASSDLRWNAIGVQLQYLNPPAVSYAAAKALGARRLHTCDFDAIGYYDTDAEQAWNRLMTMRIAYYVTVDPKVYPIPASSVDLTVNQLNAPILAKVMSDGSFQLQPAIDGYQGIWIFRRGDQINHVASGRALSDQGHHQEAIAELNTAVRLEPQNVEAWANLAVAYERAGDFRNAIVAGTRARDLNPHHYYVNLGLARAFIQQKEWRLAIERAEDAAGDATTPQDRETARALAAKASSEVGRGARVR
jgi:tetratricopeptide (TPR) repeat protein